MLLLNCGVYIKETQIYAAPDEGDDLVRNYV